MREVIRDIEKWLASGEQVCLATVVETWGSSPRPAGSKMAVSSAGQIAGSVSNGCVEADVVTNAQEVIAHGQPRLLRYGVSDELAFSVGLSCGGEISVLLQPVDWTDAPGSHRRFADAVKAGRPVLLATAINHAHLGKRLIAFADDANLEGQLAAAVAQWLGPRVDELLEAESCVGAKVDDFDIFIDVQPAPSRIVIVGAIHIAEALVPMAHQLGYQVIIVDPREAFCNPERFGSADQLVVAWPDEGLDQLGLDRTTYVVILTHDPKFDHPALKAALAARPRYIGAIGSRRTNQARSERLRQAGVLESDISRIHAPVGLDLGARSAEETALAILAEITAVRRGRTGGMLVKAAQPANAPA